MTFKAPCGIEFDGIKCNGNCKDCKLKLGIQCHIGTKNECNNYNDELGKCMRERCWMDRREGEY